MLPIYRWMAGVGLAIALLLLQPTTAQAAVNPAELARAVQEVEQLDMLRSGLASSLEGQTEAPTMETMKEVCRPVGMRAMELSKENGWQVKQIATKYRNPAHAPDTPHARMALAQFEQNPERMGLWENATLDGQTGIRYYRRINVEASCLACHGQQDRRPQFVKDNYPQDLAFNFKVGDLRGMYAVFIPNVKEAIQGALQP